MKRLNVFLVVAALFSACKNETLRLENGKPVAESPSGKPGKTMDEVRANAIPEADLVGRASSSLRVLQEEYTASEGKMPGLGKVTVFMDDKFTVLIRNETGKDVIETKFSLKSLTHENGGIKLLPDTKPGEYPGLQIAVKEGGQKVEVSTNGKVTKEDHLIIYMPERKNIEQITPALVQALNIAKEAK